MVFSGRSINVIACNTSCSVSAPGARQDKDVRYPGFPHSLVGIVLALGCSSTSSDSGSSPQGDVPVDITPSVFVTLSTGLQLGGYAALRVDCTVPTASPRSVMVVVEAPYVQNASGRWDNGDYTKQWSAGAEVGTLDPTGTMSVPVTDGATPKVPYAGVRFGDPTTPKYASSGVFSFTLGAGRTVSASATVKPDEMSASAKGTYSVECKVPASALGQQSNGTSGDGQEQLVVDKSFQTTCCAPFAAFAKLGSGTTTSVIPATLCAGSRRDPDQV